MDILMKLSSPFAAISAIIIGLQYLVLAAGFVAFMISVARPTTLWTHDFGLQVFGVAIASLVVGVGFRFGAAPVRSDFAGMLLVVAYVRKRRVWILVINAAYFCLGLVMIVLEATSGLASSSAHLHGETYLESGDYGTRVIDRSTYLQILTVHNLWYPLSMIFIVGSLAVTFTLSVRSANLATLERAAAVT
jgi:hypothetical protein